MGFTFVDVFAGCGGLSLGLIGAGGKGLLAVEKSEDAFETLFSNLGAPAGPFAAFEWTSLIEPRAMGIRDLLTSHRHQLKKIAPDVDVLAGGPPCQGFSVYGRRNRDDGRNRLYLDYLDVVDVVRPRIVLLENVTGIDMPFMSTGEESGKYCRDTVAFRIVKRLQAMGYKTHTLSLCASDFGVPQIRKRFFVVAVRTRKDLRELFQPSHIEKLRKEYLQTLDLKLGEKVSVKEALSDLELSGKKLIPCVDVKNRLQIDYEGPVTSYQSAMHMDMAKLAAPNSMRLAKHSVAVQEKFELIQKLVEPGKRIGEKVREQLNTTKHRIHLLDADAPSATVTTLPDDLVHYSEPRILTVRETARLQSFPDWFGFAGRYTTGGQRRIMQCPRYTQVGNAVPVRLAQFMGYYVADILESISTTELLRLAA